MNIVQVPRQFVRSAWGGAETVILESCKCLRQLGHETQILCPDVADGLPHPCLFPKESPL